MAVLRLLCALALVTGFGPHALAQSEITLEHTIGLWLNGDDKASLNQLSELAKGGSSDARLLLGRIGVRDLGPSPYRASLSSQAALFLFRHDNGTKFGQSWLAVEASIKNELAASLLDAKRPTPNLALIRRLHDLGEREAADHPTRILALRGTLEMKKFLAQSAYLLDDLRPYLAYLSQEAEPRGDGLHALRHIAPEQRHKIGPDNTDALGMAELLALGLGFGDHLASNIWRANVEAWLLNSASARPISRLCERNCPTEVGPCAFAFLALSGGYYEVIRFDSPLEALIPQDVFLNSVRAQQMVLRRSALARTETNLKWLSDLPQLGEISQCALELTVRERSKFQ